MNVWYEDYIKPLLGNQLSTVFQQRVAEIESENGPLPECEKGQMCVDEKRLLAEG